MSLKVLAHLKLVDFHTRKQRLLVYIVNPMFSKNNQRGKIIIPDIRSRENSKGRSLKRNDPEHINYGTDQKRQLQRSQASDIEVNEATSCVQCRARLSQFVTKKPTHPTDRGTQTSHKPFLIDLIEQRVENLCRNNSKLNRLLEERQQQLLQKQQQIAQIQDKFTSILLSLAQEVAGGRKLKGEWHELKRILSTDSDTPAYLKALQFDC